MEATMKSPLKTKFKTLQSLDCDACTETHAKTLKALRKARKGGGK